MSAFVSASIRVLVILLNLILPYSSSMKFLLVSIKITTFNLRYPSWDIIPLELEEEELVRSTIIYVLRLSFTDGTIWYLVFMREAMGILGDLHSEFVIFVLLGATNWEGAHIVRWCLLLCFARERFDSVNSSVWLISLVFISFLFILMSSSCLLVSLMLIPLNAACFVYITVLGLNLN